MASTDAQFIYTFNEVDTGEVRYVGVTNNLKMRMRDHLYKARSGIEQNHKANWIRRQLANGIEPAQTVIEVTSPSLRVEREIFWIAHYRALGMRLTNATDGGDGTLGLTVSAETREKIASSRRGVPRTLEARMAMRRGRKGWKPTPEHVQNIANALRGRVKSDQEKEPAIKARRDTSLLRTPAETVFAARAEYLELLGTRQRAPIGVREALCKKYGLTETMGQSIFYGDHWLLRGR